jgi:molybdopterin converting factor small subunit
VKMSVEVELSSVFERYTGGHLNTRVEGKTVRECLHDLVRQFPKLKRMLLDKGGNLMHAYDYFINGESVYPKDMNAPLQDGDKLNVLYIIRGG